MFGSKLTVGLEKDLEATKESCQKLANELSYKIIVDEAGNVWLNKGTTCELVRGWYTLEKQLFTKFLDKFL